MEQGHGKKRLNNWLIAAVFLILTYLIASILGFLYGAWFYLFGLVKLTIFDTYSNVLLQWSGELVQLGSIWIGVKYASRYVETRYELLDIAHVRNVANGYMIFAMLLNFISGLYIIRSSVSLTLVVIYIVGDILTCIVFFYASKHYLRAER